MLRIEELNVNYGAIRALRKVSLNINGSQICSILGTNGAGKSTLLRTIMGLVQPVSGTIELFENEISGWPTHKIVQQGIALCPEGRQVFKEITVRENLLAGAYTNNNRKSVQEQFELVYTLFPILADRMNQMAGTLSGGEQQMLSLGRALMSRPRLLMLDEPTMGLAPTLVDLLFSTIRKIHDSERIPILMVEQNVEMALEISDYAYVLEVGEVVLQGSSADLLQTEEVRNKYLGV